MQADENVTISYNVSVNELTIKILMLRSLKTSSKIKFYRLSRKQSMLIMFPDLISFNSPHDLLSFYHDRS